MAGKEAEEMGEQALAPQNNEETEESENSAEEYNMLETKLDELNSALDFLEQKNDHIHAQLIELLQSNREIRQEIQEENNVQQNASLKPNNS